MLRSRLSSVLTPLVYKNAGVQQLTWGHSVRLSTAAADALIRPKNLKSGDTIPGTYGSAGTKDFRVFLFDRSATKVSAWHDISLNGDDTELAKSLRKAHGENIAPGSIIHMVNEIPAGTTAKMEVSKKEHFHPVAQDLNKDGSLRFFSYGRIPFNYGTVPQTFSDPNALEPGTSFKGDGDPIDVVEIGQTPLQIGEVVPVRVLGALALIDGGEMDWKIVALRLSDSRVSELTNSGVLDHHFPGMVNMVREWFRMYKTTDGKKPNIFAYAEQFLDVNITTDILARSNERWAKLVSETNERSTTA